MRGAQVEAARFILGWTPERLAKASNVHVSSVYLLVRLGSAGAEDDGRIRAALESAGIEFIDGPPPGARRRVAGARPIAVAAEASRGY